MRIHHLLCVLYCWGVPAALCAQLDSTALKYAASITTDDLKRHLEVLASDAYEGRDTGKEGQKKAARYLREAFNAMGIPAIHVEEGISEGYFQPFTLVQDRSGSLSLTTGYDTLQWLEDLFYIQENISGSFTVDQLRYLGRSNEWAGTTKDAVVLMRSTAPATELRSNLHTWTDQARSAGARLLLVAQPGLREEFSNSDLNVPQGRLRQADTAPRPRSGPQVMVVDDAVVDALLARGTWAKLQRSRKPRQVSARFTVHHDPAQLQVHTENVLAYIEGSDKKDELVVLTAHYDHVGVEKGEVYNGADDDGSGTVALLEMAEAFAQAKAAGHGPRRSILIMPVSGEEKGLLGSEYYSDHPVFPLEHTVADLNIDMIGRTDSAHAGKDPYIYIIGSDRLSSELHAINEQANRLYAGLRLDYTYNAADDPNRFYYRSDHYNFARKGIPSIFYFSGVHEDYHKPTDDVEKIEFDRLRQRTLLVFHTAWQLANQEQRIVADKPVEKPR
ncbi:MAG TPA: M28 family peptidase [Flavobacteriales bacterium]|jgi:hypothetical protein|nr:M28 family peptidase [Flavobacteriales bacterium]